MMLILIILLVIVLCGGFYGFNAGAYGAAPFGGIVGIILLVVLLWLLFGGGLHRIY